VAEKLHDAVCRCKIRYVS